MLDTQRVISGLAGLTACVALAGLLTLTIHPDALRASVVVRWRDGDWTALKVKLLRRGGGGGLPAGILNDMGRHLGQVYPSASDAALVITLPEGRSSTIAFGLTATSAA